MCQPRSPNEILLRFLDTGRMFYREYLVSGLYLPVGFMSLPVLTSGPFRGYWAWVEDSPSQVGFHGLGMMW